MKDNTLFAEIGGRAVLEKVHKVFYDELYAHPWLKNFLNITAELFELRSQILRRCILECGVPEALADRWIRIDGAFKHSLVKSDIDQCEKRYTTDTILDFPKPG